MRILFISRKFPPQIGGMESHAFQLLQHLRCEYIPLVLKKSQKHLVWFVPFIFFRALFLASRVDLVYFSDGLLAPVGVLLRLFTHKPFVLTLHGLDVTYAHWLYRLINLPAIRKADALIVVSRTTFQDAVDRGVPRNHIAVIPNGVNAEVFQHGEQPSDLTEFVGPALPQKTTVLLSIGRLVKRKGIAWFVEHVMLYLPENFIYLIAGDGPERKRILHLIRKLKLQKRVYMLGRILDQERAVLFYNTHAFVMPNIRVAADREGFGIVALEAASCGLPVIAARLEGIPEAIHDGKNGFLLPSGDAKVWIDRLPQFVTQGQNMRAAFRAYTRANFDWTQIAGRYIQIFERLLDQKTV